MSELAALVRTERARHSNAAGWIVAAVLCTFLVWAAIAPLEEVAIAAGEVIPQGKVKVVQHLEGGIVREIFVSEGQTVAPGDPLVQLDLAAGGMNQAELQVELDGLRLQRGRLWAEAHASELELPADLVTARPELAEQERRSHEARNQELRSLLSMLGEQVRQRDADLAELRSRKDAIAQQIAITRKKLAIATDLVSQGLMSKLEHLQLEGEVARLAGDLAALGPAMPRAEAALAEAREHEREQTLKFQRAAQDELTQVEVSLARAGERLERAVDQQSRAEIRSPIEGTVKNMRYHTIGGVVRPGEPIMEIVPSNETLVVEARLNPVDRGYVSEGQRARVKISSYDFVRYGTLEGTVANVAADADSSTEGQPYFRLVVQTDRSHLGTEESPLPISPGMQALVEVRTGDRSVLAYLVRPALKLRHEAFRER